jgi:hypothetical protein
MPVAPFGLALACVLLVALVAAQTASVMFEIVRPKIA